MKRLFLLIIFSIFVYAENINWLYSVKDGLQKSKELDRPLMIYVKGEHCPWCKKMEEDIFGDKDMAKVLNQKFVLVKLDKRSKDVETYFPDVYITPTTFFIGYNKKPLYRIDGFMDDYRFSLLTVDILNMYKESKKSKK